MRLGWGARHVIALALFGTALVVVTGFLEIWSAVRLGFDRARAEAGMVTRVIVAEVSQAAQASPDDPNAAISADARIPLVVKAANAQAASVCYVAVCDSTGRALVHSLPDLVGTPLEPRPPLPGVATLGSALPVIAAAFRGPAGIYEVVTPLARGDVHFGTIRVGIAGGLVRDEANTVLRRTGRTAAIEIALALGLGWVMASLFRRRIAGLEAGVAALSAGRFEAEIPESGVDEFSRIARDLNLVSRRFQAEREAQIGTFQRAADLIADGLLVVGPDGEVALLNDLAARRLGLSAAGARGKSLADLLPADHAVRRLVDELRTSGERTLAIDLPDEDGGPRYAAVGHRFAEAGAGMGGVLVEIRERAELQEITSLVDHSRVLTRLGDMASGVAHEIRNSLQTMHFALGYLRESAHQGGSPEMEEQVRKALNEVQRLENAVNGFLKVARLRSIQPVPLRPNDLLSEIGEVLDVEARLGGLELVLDLDPSPPDILGDREVLRQAIQNLVRNAIQAQPSRDHRVVLASRTQGGELRLSVIDTGPGIPAEIRDRVTELYFTTREKGSGVGLALARQVIEMHGGELEIESTPGEGTTVSLRFPSRAGLGWTAYAEARSG